MRVAVMVEAIVVAALTVEEEMVKGAVEALVESQAGWEAQKARPAVGLLAAAQRGECYGMWHSPRQ
jgi:hypothetical protein